MSFKMSEGVMMMIETNKIITGNESIQLKKFFELAHKQSNSGHRYKLLEKKKLTLGQSFFS